MKLSMIGLTIIFILAIGFITSPLPANAQKAGKVYRIGYLSPYPIYNDFMEEFRKLGWVEGQNFVIEYRSPEGKFERLPALAEELVRLKVDVIFSVLTISTRAAKKASTKIPIVFTVVSDPVGDGFVANFARPGGNITGECNNLIEISGKVLQLLTEAVPGASRFAFLWNIAHGQVARLMLEKMQAAAKMLGVTLQSVEVREAKDFKPTFSAMTGQGVQGLVMLGEPLTIANATKIKDLALSHRLPVIVHGPGGYFRSSLMSFQPDYDRQSRRADHLVDKILKGAKPADLPVELPTHYKFAINLKTAKALGITIPQSLLIQATEVIE